ncbi:MAG: hypothetical protein KDC67_15990, partial [Ignavibacteriae bacterium]|nr:hypothetical protein [Ignavibacteriota bacterium]
MKILTFVPKQYYDSPGARTYEYVSFVEVLREMGHTVHSLDHILEAKVDKDAFNDLALSMIKTGGYDLMIVVTYQDEFH